MPFNGGKIADAFVRNVVHVYVPCNVRMIIFYVTLQVRMTEAPFLVLLETLSVQANMILAKSSSLIILPAASS